MGNILKRSLLLLFSTTIGSLLTMNVHTSANNAGTIEPNPLLSEWEGRYGGVPPFDKVQVALFKPALEAAMAFRG